jgi:D-beta-D-heptose 7-phosphate kinase/D-beta-D-heptose 1-phosphate adenosyltransferase
MNLPPQIRAKILDLDGLLARLEEVRARGERVVFTNGCFDLLHVGHALMLRQARELGDFLVVAINSDASIRKLKGEGRPVVAEDERAAMLALFDFVDAVIVFDEDVPIPLLERIRPEVLAKGGDYMPETVVGRDLVESYGGRVALVPYLDGVSTTEMIRRAGGGSEG